MDNKDLFLQRTTSQWVNDIKSFVPAMYLPNMKLSEIKNGKIIKAEVIKELDNIKLYETVNNNKQLFFSGYKKKKNQVAIYLTESLTEKSPEEIHFYYYQLSKNQVIENLEKKLAEKKYNKKQSVLWKTQWYMKSQAKELIKWFISDNNPALLINNTEVFINHKRLEFSYGTPPLSTKKTENISLYFKYLKETKLIKISVTLKGKKERDEDDNDDKDDSNDKNSKPDRNASGGGLGAWIFGGIFGIFSIFKSKCSEGKKPDVDELIKNMNKKLDVMFKDPDKELREYIDSMKDVALEEAQDHYCKLYDLNFKTITDSEIKKMIKNNYDDNALFKNSLSENAKKLIAENITATGSQAYNEIIDKIKIKLNDDIVKTTTTNLTSKINNFNKSEILKKINEKCNQLKSTLVEKVKLDIPQTFNEIAETAQKTAFDKIKEMVNSLIKACNQKHIDEIKKEVEKKIPNEIKTKVEAFINLIKNNFIKTISFNENDELNNDEKNQILNDNANKIIAEFVKTNIEKININLISTEHAKSIILNLVKTELAKNIIKSEHILVKSKYEGLFNKLSEKKYYITYLKKNVSLKVPNLKQNVNNSNLEKLNCYLNEQLLYFWISDQTYQKWINNNLQEYIEKILNEKLQHQITIDNNNSYFNISDFNMEIKNNDLDKKILLQLVHNQLLDTKINIKINVV